MSSTSARTDGTDATETVSDSLTDEERAAFERLADAYAPEDDIGRIARTVLQSSEADNEEASS